MTLLKEYYWQPISKEDVYDIVSNGRKHYWFSIFLAFDLQTKKPMVINVVYDGPYTGEIIPSTSSLIDRFDCIKEYTHIILPDTDNYDYLTKLICDCINKTTIEYNLVMGNFNEMTNEEFKQYKRIYRKVSRKNPML